MNDRENDPYDRPEILLAAAFAVGRELAEILRDQEGVFPHRDRVLVSTVMRGAANRGVLAPQFRGPLSGLVDKIDRLLDAAAVEHVEAITIGADENGEIHGERRSRVVPAAMQPLVTARALATRLAALIDNVGDLLEADHLIVSTLSQKDRR